ncbi:hypothetical protein ACFXMR_34735, partial [Streptomyces griseus]
GDGGFEPYDFLPTDPWHAKDFRETRWASLKRDSGGLMADFPAASAGSTGSADPVGSADADSDTDAEAAGSAAGRPAPAPDRPGPTP